MPFFFVLFGVGVDAASFLPLAFTFYANNTNIAENFEIMGSFYVVMDSSKVI